MARYRLTSQAIADVDEIWLYIARDNVTAADRLIDRFTEVYENLSTHPGIGQAQDKYREGLRSLVVGNYVIFIYIDCRWNRGVPRAARIAQPGRSALSDTVAWAALVRLTKVMICHGLRAPNTALCGCLGGPEIRSVFRLC